MEKLRVLIVDDTTLVRQGVRSLLEQQEAIDLVGEAATVQGAFDLLEVLGPDVILLDQDMPGLNLIEAIRLLKGRLPRCEVIVLAEWPDEEQAFQALEAGATGYVLKDIHIENLVRAIEGVTTGRTLMHPRIARQLVERFRVLMRERQDRNGVAVGGLTSRELEQMVAEMVGVEIPFNNYITGLAEADVFIAVTQGDNRNVMAAQIAKHIFRVPRVVCRIYDPIREEIYRGLGLETYSPTRTTVARMKELALQEPVPRRE